LSVVQFFLLLIVRRLPSRTPEYNTGMAFSHINILLTYFAGLVLGPGVDMAFSYGITPDHVVGALLVMQAGLMIYLLRVCSLIFDPCSSIIAPYPPPQTH
jgi:hypothetical protein